jgi:hypothetical protein
MIDKNKIIEKGKQSLSFIEQLQNQIELCREAMSNPEIPLSPRVEALEGLLWAKLREDEDYNKRMEELRQWFEDMKKDLRAKQPELYEWQFEEAQIPFIRKKAKEQFKAIMIFIDKKGFMPIGEQDD